MSKLRITEIFYSLQGETNTVGVPTVFVRLTGCPLRCGYCDSEYAFKGGDMLTQADILKKVAKYKPRYVTVTGGEPLAQKGCSALLRALADAEYQVSIETSGAMDIAPIDNRVVVVMDLKTPASKESERNLWSNLDHIKPQDQIKFVICNRDDYLWSKRQIEQHHLASKCEILFSPSYNELADADLADWIIADNLPVRFQIQLHKFLWGDKPGV